MPVLRFEPNANEIKTHFAKTWRKRKNKANLMRMLDAFIVAAVPGQAQVNDLQALMENIGYRDLGGINTKRRPNADAKANSTPR